MPHRDPDTGQFLPHDTAAYSDIEVATFAGNVGVEAANVDGSTGFIGGQSPEFSGQVVLDYDEFVDRNEELVLLQAQHRLNVFANSTETADGTVSAAVEISADPAVSEATSRAPIGNTATVDGSVVGASDNDDTIDLIGRPLFAVGHAPFSDGSSGAGGGGSAGEDRYTSSMFPAEFGRFHPRDELFLNGRLVQWNVDDAGIHANVIGQHTYGVVE
jgi:hypothetical protein